MVSKPLFANRQEGSLGDRRRRRGGGRKNKLDIFSVRRINRKKSNLSSGIMELSLGNAHFEGAAQGADVRFGDGGGTLGAVIATASLASWPDLA